MWNNRTTQRIIRTGIDGYIPIYTPIQSGMSQSSASGSSDSTKTRGTGTRILTGTTTPHCSLNVSLSIDDIRKSATPYLIKSDKFDTSIDGKFTNNMVAPPIFIEVLCDKFSDSYIWDIYMSCWMNLTAGPINTPEPQFVDSGISIIDSLNKGSNLWTPSIRVVSYWSAPDHIFGKLQQLETLWVQSQTKTIKLILKPGGKIKNLRAKIMQGVDHLWTGLLLVWKRHTPKH